MKQNADNPNFEELVRKIQELNDAIEKDESLGSGFKIGHSYLCTGEAVTDEYLSSIIEYELLPLISEYWFDERSKIEQWTKKLRSVLDD
jgi:5-methylcytosine-specific restriction protein B